MKNKVFFFTFILLFICLSFLFSQKIREPAKAGSWYSKQKALLSSQIDSFLSNVKMNSISSGEILAIISPHAGYGCSGQVAAYGFKLVQEKDYKTVVIIAPTHTLRFEGCSIYPQGGYKTPLGTAEIDSFLAAKITRVSGFRYIPQAHIEEHSIEMQVPFIQKVLPKAKIVPIIMGNPTDKTIKALAKALTEVTRDKDNKVLIVASSDMSHYEPQKTASIIDKNTTSLITSLKTDVLIRKIKNRDNFLCGAGPVVCTLLYAQEKGEVKVNALKYADSTTCGSSPLDVVGYLAAAVSLEGPQVPFFLSPEDKIELLRIARLAVNQLHGGEKIVPYENQNPHFSVRKGAFVTLKKKGILRGCIGIINPVYPLYESVIKASLYAAYGDQRFPPVLSEEVKDLEFEISVLSQLEEIHDIQQIQVGKHGISIEKDGKQGLFLPQVAGENNWSRIQLLERACRKAGLSKDDWKTGAKIYVFEAIVFR